MLVYIGQATTQAILIGILAILAMPPINKKINEKFINGNKTKNTIKIISEIILFFVIVCNIPTNEDTSNNNNINNKNINNITSTVSQINNTITSNESKKNENTIENNTINQNNSISSTNETNIIQQQNFTKSTQTETTQNNNSSTKTETSTNTKSTTATLSASTSASTNNSSSTKNSTTKSSSTGMSSSSTNKASKPTASSSSQTTNVDNSRTVYVTPTGKRYIYLWRKKLNSYDIKQCYSERINSLSKMCKIENNNLSKE